MLNGHIAFLARISKNAARVLRSDLLTRIKGLERTPYLYSGFYSDALEAEYHKLVYKRYIILYAIEETEKIVRVKYVWDTRMDNNL